MEEMLDKIVNNAIKKANQEIDAYFKGEGVRDFRRLPRKVSKKIREYALALTFSQTLTKAVQSGYDQK